MIDYLPPVAAKLREFKALMLAEQKEVETLWVDIGNALNNQFLEDMTLYGIKRWEDMLGVTPKATDTIDARKFRIQVRINEELPFTIRMLEQSLTTLCGEGGFSVALDAGIYTLIVRVALTSKSNYDEVGGLLDRVVPVNMIIDLSLQYNTHRQFIVFTHGEMQAKTHDTIRNEVM